MAQNNGLNNHGNIAIAIFFILAYSALIAFFSDNVGILKFVLAIPILFGGVTLLTNTEYPIQPGRFWLSLLLMLIPNVIILWINSASLFDK